MNASNSTFRHVLTRTSLALAALVLLVAGCSTGSAPSVPTVEATTPAGGAADVAVGSDIVVEFSEPMAAAATEAAFSVSPAVACDYAWNAEGTVLTCSPQSDLAPDEVYTVTVAADAESADGATLDAAHEFSFTTETPLYTLDVTVAGQGGVSSVPAGIDCGTTCSADFLSGTDVTLTATPEADWQFDGWSGDADCADGSVTMTGARSCVATFVLPGSLYFSQDSNATGLYELDMETGAATLVGVGTTSVTSATVGLAGRGARQPLIGSTYSTLHYIEQDGSGTTQFSSVSAEGLAYDGQNDIVYAIFNNTFRSVSPDTGLEIATLAASPTDIEGITADSAAGVIYGIGDGTSLYAYNIASDTWSTVGDTGASWNLGGLAFDEVSGMLFAVGNDADAGGLYTIDPSDASTTLVGDSGLTLNGGLAWVPGQ